jgi:DNA-binding NarL/FixJ family response regulator
VGLERLSDREKETLCFVARGLSNREIALEMGISTDTVKKHVSAILTKLDARNRARAAVAFAKAQEGLR